MFIKLPVSHTTCSKHVKTAFLAITLLASAQTSLAQVPSSNNQVPTSNNQVPTISKELPSNQKAPSNSSEELPLWELGLGIGALHQPYYIGTKQNRTFAFPVPVPIYRGDVLKSDDEGVRAELLNNERFKLDLSLDFNLAVDSDDVDLRAGMPDIDSRLQIGPSLEVKLAEGDHDQWLLNFPLRASIGVGSNGLDESGFTFAPNLTYFRDFDWGKKEWRAGMAVGPQFGTSDYQNLYYGVAPEFATEARPAYEADSGYSGSRLLLSLRSNDKDRLWVWFIRYENISGASFEDSPLVETNDGLSVGLIFSKYLFKSKKTVTR